MATLEELEARINLLEQTINPGTLNGDLNVAGSLNAMSGELRYGNGNAPDAGFSGIRIGWPGFEYNGETWHIVGVELDSITVGFRSTDGYFIFSSGKGFINQDGINLQGIRYAIRHFAYSDDVLLTDRRDSWIQMILDTNRNIPKATWQLTAGTDSENLIANGDAEHGDLSHWTQSDDAFSNTAEEQNGGTYSFACAVIAEGDSQTLTSDRSLCAANLNYKFTLYTKEVFDYAPQTIVFSTWDSMAMFDRAITTPYPDECKAGASNNSGGTYNAVWRGVLQFDYSAMPAYENILTSIITSNWKNGATTSASKIKFYPCKRTTWNSTTGDWVHYEGTSAWGTSGAGNTTTDRDATAVYTSPAFDGNEEKTLTISLTEAQTIPLLNGTRKGLVVINDDEVAGADQNIIKTLQVADPIEHEITYTPFGDRSYYTFQVKWYDNTVGGTLLKTDTICVQNGNPNWNLREKVIASPAGALSFEIVITTTFGNAWFFDDLYGTAVIGEIGIDINPFIINNVGQLGNILSGERRLPSPALACVSALVLTGSGNLTNGNYSYKYVYVDAYGQTVVSPASNIVTVDATHKQIGLTAVSVGPPGTLKRYLYRTIAGGATYLYLAQINDNTTTTYTDNIADASLGAAPVAYNMTGSRALFPRSAMVFAQQTISNATRGYSMTASQPFAFYYGPSAANANDGDWISANVNLEEGTYTLDLLGVTTTDCGKTDVYVDGILVAAALDWYSAATAYNVFKSTAGVSVVGNGYHRILIKVNGKGTGTDYRVLLTAIIFRKATDLY